MAIQLKHLQHCPLMLSHPPILSYDEWEAIAMPQQQQLVEATRHD